MAIKAKKYGAFAGVFTPSLLTILGVIMYMRLGWVVGNAGLLYALVVILLAHVISLSTGLSVSSIATDKRIKAGGIYYVLSRSLGLPMGGAIGITLFIGTALSISLYLVGFAESVLSVDGIRQFLGLEQDVNGFRIIASAAIMVLVIIAFISTSLAIKTQFYILGAIALSLISIGIGFFIHPSFHPENIALTPGQTNWDPVLIFAVFFPAVTGFTAGIAMSGDLKDPKKAIPRGTMGAIAVGFLVYIGLALGFGFFVNRDLLVNDTNFLLKIAWFAPLVIAGIWGATLSSALGGILGGPRILQAIASDRIGPKLFARGYGVNNEPRNALIFIFLIAEAGILIGELNVIAEVVSMFYLASYGFINLAFYLESWASTDFRPSFKVNKYVGLIGFITAFGVMFRLNFLAMIAALVIVGGIYFYLKRRQLKLEYGDVWQSVWSTFMRTALQKMDNTETHERNWQPNIILFSGGTKKRPHLLELGKSFVGTHGVLSNFDLIEQKDAKILFPKNKQSTPGQLSEKGVFTRQQTVQDIYAGIDMIARTYGFSGVEPNTVMLGWARQTRNPERFAALLNTFYDLDLNVILLGYDKRFGYGQYKTIDIWVKDQSNNGNLALTLTKLLMISDKWQHARARLLIVNYRNEKSEIVARKAEAILEQMRVSARVKVINNQVDQKPFYDIVQEESDTTDLVFFEIPDFTEGSAHDFIEHTNDLLEKIGTVVMISGSSSFKKLKIGIEPEEIRYPEQALTAKHEPEPITEVELPADHLLAEAIQKTWIDLQMDMKQQIDYTYSPLLQYRSNKIKATRQIVLKSVQTVIERINDIKKDQQKQFLNRLKTSLIARLDTIIDEQIKLIEKEKTDYLQNGLEQSVSQIASMLQKAPEKVNILLYDKNLVKQASDRFTSRFFRWRKRISHSKKTREKGIEYTLLFKKALRSETPMALMGAHIKAVKQFSQFHDRFISEYRKLFYAIVDAFSYLENMSTDTVGNHHQLNTARQSMEEHLNQLDALASNEKPQLTQLTANELQIHFNKLSLNLSKIPANHFIDSPPLRAEKEMEASLLEFPGQWATKQQINLNALLLELKIMQVDFRLSALMRESIAEIRREVNQDILKQVDELELTLHGIAQANSSNIRGKAAQTLNDFNYDDQQLKHKINRVIEKVFRNTRTIQRVIPETVVLFKTKEPEGAQTEMDTIPLAVSRIMDYLIQNLLMEPFHAQTHKLIQSIHESATRIEDSVRLISLSARKEKNETLSVDIDFVDDMTTFITDQLQKIKAQHEIINNAFETFSRSVQNHLKETVDEFAVYRLIKSAESINPFSSQKKATASLQKIKSGWQKMGNYVQEQSANLWHSQSEARLMARQFNQPLGDSPNPVAQAISITEKASPSILMKKKIPFYYQQLFSGKFNFQPELWMGRADAINQARLGVQRYKSGKRGIVLITGRRKSGKSFFASYLASNVFINRKVYNLKPAGAGTSQPEQIIEMLREATGYSGNADEIIHALPENSVVMVDDLELLWEKSFEGLKGIEMLTGLMKNHCQKILFVVNCEQHAWGIISKQVPIAELAIQHIQLNPFNSKELQQIIMLRHRTSGFGLRVDSAAQNTLSLSNQARLFSRIFTLSDGNVGSALLLWMASINDFKDNTIHIQSPAATDYQLLETLDASLRMVLLQCVLHQRLDVDKLQRVTRLERPEVIHKLQVLNRAGLLVEQAGPAFEINPFVYDAVVKSIADDYL